MSHIIPPDSHSGAKGPGSSGEGAAVAQSVTKSRTDSGGFERS